MEQIPFLSLVHQHNQIRVELQGAITQVLDNNLFVLGSELENFESEFASYCNISYCAGVGNGLDAITLSLLACGISPGDHVIVPANTYIATWLALSRVGAVIVPVDANPNTFNIDVTKIEDAITPETRAIVPVHLYGQACDMTSIDKLARRFNLYIIEDNAQAHGAKWLEKFTGTYGTISATSFYPTKNLGALGDGGAITTFDENLIHFVKRYRNYGFEKKNIGRDKGLNSRLDELQAAILRVKLRQLAKWNDDRRKLAAYYLNALDKIDDITLPRSDKEAHHVYHLFVIRIKRRNGLQKYLLAKGIETMVHYPIPPHLQVTYENLNLKEGSFPVTESMAETSLSLPLWPGMTSDQQDYIIDSIKAFVNF